MVDHTLVGSISELLAEVRDAHSSSAQPRRPTWHQVALVQAGRGHGGACIKIIKETEH